MKVEDTAITDLRPYPGNARTHSKKQIKQIAKSIGRFGFCNPVLVDDGNQIIAGHGRVEAAKLLGMETVLTVRLSHLSDAEKRAYILADNKLAEKAGWDREILAIELQALAGFDFDLELTGFDQAEIDLIIDEIDGTDDKAEAPPPAYSDGPMVSRPGDLWMLGNHALLCGDARDESAYGLLMRGDEAQFVFTDPPYNVPIDGHVCGLGRIRHKDFAMGYVDVAVRRWEAYTGKQALLGPLGETFEDICDIPGRLYRGRYEGCGCVNRPSRVAQAIATKIQQGARLLRPGIEQDVSYE